MHLQALEMIRITPLEVVKLTPLVDRICGCGEIKTELIYAPIAIDQPRIGEPTKKHIRHWHQTQWRLRMRKARCGTQRLARVLWPALEVDDAFIKRIPRIHGGKLNRTDEPFLRLL